MTVDSQPNRTSWFPLSAILGGAFIFFLLLFCSGIVAWHITGTDHGTVYVDNGTGEEMVVFVDDELVKTVPPNFASSVRIPVGKQTIRVEQEGSTVFEETKLIEREKYVLNPDNSVRYFVRSIEPPDIQPRKNNRARQSFEDELADLLSVVSPIKHSGPWFQYPGDWDYDDFPLGEYIPYQIRDGHKAMLRMSRQDYELLQELRALNGRRPTEEQLHRFTACRKRLLRNPRISPSADHD